MTPRFLIVPLCLFCSLTCFADSVHVNGEATYISFSVPGAVNTVALGVNASGDVAGYYTDLRGVNFGFLREPDGTITSFNVPGAVWTQPAAISEEGDITGIYGANPTTSGARGFLRYADGRIITFDASLAGTLPTSINNFDETAGIYEFHPQLSFLRSRTGAVTVLAAPGGGATAAMAVNASGSVVGYNAFAGGWEGFVAHPDGYWAPISIPVDPGCPEQTIASGINTAGTIVGWTINNGNGTPACAVNNGRYFALSPGGRLTFFLPPGEIEAFDSLSLPNPALDTQGYLSINDAGDIAGSYRDPAKGVLHGFVRNPYGTLTSFDPPEGRNTNVHGINNAGAIVGSYEYCTGGGEVAFVRIPTR